MKPLIKIPFFVACVFIFSTSIFCSCSKSNDSSGNGNFAWTYNGVTTSTNTDTAFVNYIGLAYPPFTIVAGFPRSSSSTAIQKRVEINLSSFNTGAYTITATPNVPNRLSYIDDLGNNLYATAGTVNITANNGSILSGNFAVTLTDGIASTSQLTGNFTNMAIR